MTQQEAELRAKHENERRLAIGRFITYPEYYAFKDEVEKCIAMLKDIDNIDAESNISVEVQVEASKLAKDIFLKLLADLNAYALKDTPKASSYN